MTAKAELITQRRIKKTKPIIKVFGFAFFKKQTGVGSAHVRHEVPIKKREAETVNQKYGVLLGSGATVTYCESRLNHTKNNKEHKIT